MWKPGQLVTIDRHVYRIKKLDKDYLEFGFGTCMQCSENAMLKGNDAPCEMDYGETKRLTSSFCIAYVPSGCYLDLVYPVQG